MKILLIESDSAFANELATVLEARGLEARITADGREGLDLAKVDRPELIVLCVELPKMSGYSVCNKLKKDELLKSIPLIIISAEATPETFEQHRKLKTRAEGYLIKPFESEALLDLIGELIELPSEPTPVASEELVALEDVELAPTEDDADALLQPDAERPAASPDDDLHLLDEAFEGLATESLVDEAPPADATDSGEEPAATEDDAEATAPEDGATGAQETLAGEETLAGLEEADAALAALGLDTTESDLESATALLDEPLASPSPAFLAETEETLATPPPPANDAELIELRDRVFTLQADLARSSETAGEREQALQETTARIRSLEIDLESSRTAAQASEESRTALEERARVAEANVQRAEEAAQATREEVQRAKEQIRVLETESKERAAEAKLLGEQAQRSERARRDAEGVAGTATDRCRVAEERTRIFEERTRVAEERARVAEERARVAEERTHQAEVLAHQAEERSQAADDRAQAADNEARAAGERAGEAASRAAAADAHAQTLEQENASVTGRLAEADQALAQKAAEIEQARNDGAKLATELEQARKGSEALAAELETARARTADKEKELDALRDELEKLGGDLEQTRGELNSTRQSAQSARLEAETKIADLAKRIEDLLAQNAKHEERVVKAYQKIKGDEKIREKTRKALVAALQLLEERNAAHAIAPPTDSQPAATDVPAHS